MITKSAAVNIHNTEKQIHTSTELMFGFHIHAWFSGRPGLNVKLLWRDIPSPEHKHTEINLLTHAFFSENSYSSILGGTFLSTFPESKYFLFFAYILHYFLG